VAAKTHGGARSGGTLLRALIVLLAPFVLLLLYVLLPFGGERVVLLGSDARAGEASRSDTLLVAKAGGGTLAVPRDTLVEVPGVGEDKVNSAFAYGGPELAVETLEGLTGLPIAGHAVLDFGGTQEIVDALGGVTVNVEAPIETEQDGEFFSIPAGPQELNGREALAYVRYRGDPTADIGRVGRQQEFLSALASEAASPANLPRLPATALAIWRNVETDLSPLQAARLALRFALLGGGQPAEIYPGTPQYIDGISYWVPDPQAGAGAVARTVE
jgi:polyisoprenyl-teichoic acid--peptidoglycan teichoic acid transferase